MPDKPSGKLPDLPFDFGPKIFSVSEIVSKADAALAARFLSVLVEGEIAEGKLYDRSGHFYFSLKDKTSRMPCVMFRNDVRRQSRLPRDGELARVRGSLGVHVQTGAFRFAAEYFEFVGEGELREQFERLKKKLSEEGLFDEERKRPLPALPNVIGVVTSPEGAVVHDLIKVIHGRFPPVKILISPAPVQGADAPPKIIAAINRLEKRDDVDLIIVARGGGSAEDLACFNDERLARRVYACEKPVVSAIGHDVDFTILDFVADVRAATPSHAGEMTVPAMPQITAAFDRYKDALARAVTAGTQSRRYALSSAKRELDAFPRRLRQTYLSLDVKQNVLRAMIFQALQKRRAKLDAAQSAFLRKSPQRELSSRSNALANARRALETNAAKILSEKKNALGEMKAKLGALDPSAVLSRGYAVVFDENGEAAIDRRSWGPTVARGLACRPA